MKDYLKLPLRFESIFQRSTLAVCSLKDSISRNLHLLITTSIEENKQNLDYGSSFWDNDYDIHLTNDSRKQIILDNVKKQINLFEKRIINVVVDVSVKQAVFNGNINPELKRRIEITVKGNLARSNESYIFQTGFFIGPLTFD